MPLPAVFALLSARQRALVPFFEAALDRGLSATRAILVVFRGPGGPGIRTQRAFDLARLIRPRIQFRRLLENVGESFIPNPDRLPQALGRTIDNVVFRFRVETEEGDELMYSLGRRDVASRGTLETQMRGFLEDDPTRYPLNIRSVRLVDAVGAGEAGVVPA